MSENQANLVQRRIIDAAIASAFLHPLVGFVVHRVAVKLIPGLIASPWTLIGAFGATWLAMFLVYLRCGERAN